MCSKEPSGDGSNQDFSGGHGARSEGQSFSRDLAADADGAEAQDYVAAGGGPAEAQHRTEAGEKQHLIELMTQIDTRWSGQNLVAHHLAVLMDSDIQQEAMRQRELQIMLLGSPGLRIVRERKQLSGTQNVEGDIVGDGPHGNAGRDQLQH